MLSAHLVNSPEPDAADEASRVSQHALANAYSEYCEL
jgi:hypothetical protein